MKFGQRDFGASEAWFSGIQNEKVAGGGSRIELAGVPAVLGQTVKVNSNAKAQFSKYKTCSWKASTNPGNPKVDVQKKVGCGEGREPWSTSQRATRKTET